MRQYLEQMMYGASQEPEEDLRVYQVGDLEELSASALYIGSGPMKSFGSGPLKFKSSAPLKPTFEYLANGGITIPLGNLGLDKEGIKDIHDTYSVDRFENLFKGHTSITGEKKKKKFLHLPWWDEDND